MNFQQMPKLYSRLLSIVTTNLGTFKFMLISHFRDKRCAARQSLKLVLIVFLMLPLVSGEAAASRYDYEITERGHYEAESAAKATRGITNVLFGWTEIVQTPVYWAEPLDRGPLSAIFVGVPYGIARALGRTLVGVYEVATFYAPQPPIFGDIQGDVR